MTGAAHPVQAEPEAVDVRPAHVFWRIAQGELGSLRVVLALAVVWAIFYAVNDRFLTSVNLTNLTLQIAGVATISVGVVLVLLLGEIDLSVGAVSGLCAGVMAVLTTKHGWSPELAIVAALAVGAAIGAFNGVMVTKVQIPSFVVTLAGLLAWQGALLWVLGETGTINLRDSIITDLTGTFFDEAVGWIVAFAAIALYVGTGWLGRRQRAKAGLPNGPFAAFVLRSVVVAIAVLASIAIFNDDRGLPLAVCIVVGLVVVFTFLTERTRWGRHAFAVGGNAEAARRAGIRVDRVRISVFMIASTLAAAGGVLLASRLLAVNQSSGGGDLLLLAIAGPVIAGTSLFGGRGYVASALLGALVIGSISNGMDLEGLESDVKYMITGAVLLAAVAVDAVTRRTRAQTGRV
jgi:D-xylose transport system permease protein